MKKLDIRSVDVTQYIHPLREGGSLPAIVKGSDDFMYVLKFHGAGQGKKALIAEFIGGELARAMDLLIPEIVLMSLNDSFSKTEPDEEIQDLLKFSIGLNLGMHFLSEAITFDPLVHKTDALVASKIVLLDSMINNIDRTVKNTNLLYWQNKLWVIDNGASLYFHHDWDNWKNHLNGTFPFVKDHVLLQQATQLPQAIEAIKEKINEDKIKQIVQSIPEEWLQSESESMTADEMCEAYTQFLTARLLKLETLAQNAEDAR